MADTVKTAKTRHPESAPVRVGALQNRVVVTDLEVLREIRRHGNAKRRASPDDTFEPDPYP